MAEYAAGVQQITFTEDARKLVVQQSEYVSGGRRGENFYEITLWGRNIADDDVGTLGGGTATLQVSYLAEPSTAEDTEWQDYTDTDGNTVTFTLGRTEVIRTRAPWLAINLAGATSPDLVFLKV